LKLIEPVEDVDTPALESMPVTADDGLMIPDIEGAAGRPVETVMVGRGAGANEIEMYIPADTSGPGTTMKGPVVIFRGIYRPGSVFDDLFSID
jgi:hypothetical protein